MERRHNKPVHGRGRHMDKLRETHKHRIRKLRSEDRRKAINIFGIHGWRRPEPIHWANGHSSSFGLRNAVLRRNELRIQRIRHYPQGHKTGECGGHKRRWIQIWLCFQSNRFRARKSIRESIRGRGP